MVAPAPDAKLADGTQVAVQFGRRVTFTIDGQPQTVWTTATTVDQAIDALSIDTAGADCPPAAARRSAGTAWRHIATAEDGHHRRAGKKRTVTTALTVADALAAAKIKSTATTS